MYKAFNWGTGEAVAIKQIKLTDLPKSELRMIEVRFLGSHHTAILSHCVLQTCSELDWVKLTWIDHPYDHRAKSTFSKIFL